MYYKAIKLLAMFDKLKKKYRNSFPLQEKEQRKKCWYKRINKGFSCNNEISPLSRLFCKKHLFVWNK